MTTSTESTVSAEGIKRFAELMAEELGLTDLLTAERWGNPGMMNRPSPVQEVKCRQNQLRLTTSAGKKGN
ncbi:hypothetical protein JJB07_18410 [Tumebacillus sp. ITR2]|uniref:Small, acid-soluble spore protein, alpha/beta type n=1 Tax=Tumebacillus amylolyticus TaxID=2801339 RepID=A0ABS1JE82_9BACL|nr:hypothetical protein [Tumebacillus amylolyticus]MBL0388581.1 hypothetical protein [Tumebacillus amylolyticus]